MSSSGVYEGKVIHQRHYPKAHRLEYKVFSLFVDLDELDEIDRSLRLFGHNRRALFSLLDRDHGKGEGRDLRAHVREHLRSAGIRNADGPIRLLCYPRIMGYVFNPLSVFYCHDNGDRLRAVIYEVNNTHGERHSYVIPVDEDKPVVRHACDKKFFVSPFLPMDCRYRFQVNNPGDRIQLFIHETHRDRPILDAWFTGRRQPLSDRTLLKMAFSVPLLSFKIILGIHWEAFKLWAKGLPVFSHPEAPRYGATFVDDHFKTPGR